MEPAVSTREARTRAVAERARALGFDAVGVADARVPLTADLERYDAFVEQGYAGEMTWLTEHRELRGRLDGEGILAGAASVVCVAQRYQRDAADEATDPEFARRIARYARGRDYHNGMRKKLRALARFLRGLEEGARARPMTDDVPVLERAWAARAGLGFVGKNGMLIVPGQGSFVLLGEVVTTVELEPAAPMPERCGSCRACLDACPTSAFPAPFVLDPRRCISYLTIELRGPVPVELRAGIGEHLFGCDDCQTVCPFNRGAASRTRAVAERYRPLERWAGVDLRTALEQPAGFAALAEGSPLHRATSEGLARNAAIVLGNRRDASAVPQLRRVAETHGSATVREAASWALLCISGAVPTSNP
jgi:epoxyqueuosine reductase